MAQALREVDKAVTIVNSAERTSQVQALVLPGSPAVAIPVTVPILPPCLVDVE